MKGKYNKPEATVVVLLQQQQLLNVGAQISGYSRDTTGGFSQDEDEPSED